MDLPTMRQETFSWSGVEGTKVRAKKVLHSQDDSKMNPKLTESSPTMMKTLLMKMMLMMNTSLVPLSRINHWVQGTWFFARMRLEPKK